MKRRRLQSIVNHSLAILVSLIMFIPVYLVLVNSLKTQAEANAMGVGFPTALNWANFATVIERGKLVTAFGNSVLYAVAATVIGTTVAALAAYVLSRNRTRFNRFVYFFIIMGIAMPTNFVTLMKVMQLTHLINTQLGIILLYASTSIPFSVFLDLRLRRHAATGTGRGRDHRRLQPLSALLLGDLPFADARVGHGGGAEPAGNLE